MNILFVIPYVPDPIRVRAFNFICSTAAAGHSVTLATLWSSDQERKALDDLRPQLSRVIAAPLPRWRSAVNGLGALPTGQPIQSRYCWEPALAQQLKALFKAGQPPPFDVIHVEHLRGVVYALLLQELTTSLYGAGRPPIIWDSVDNISHLFRQAARASKTLSGRLMTRLELPRTERYERWLVEQLDTILVTSPHDQQAFFDLWGAAVPPSNIEVVPNGVDLHTFHPNPEVDRQPATIVVTGKMSYHANVTMVDYLVREIMPLVWSQRPDAHLNIVGKDPVRLIREFGRQERITVTGMVPEMRVYLQNATIAVAPVRYGAGIQNKVLEAMGCGTAVVASSQAVSAIAAEPGHHLLTANDPAGFAQAIIDLLNDPAQQQRVGQAGRAFVETHHDWQKITSRLLTLYQAQIHASKVGAP